jgi:hypothetical protein
MKLLKDIIGTLLFVLSNVLEIWSQKISPDIIDDCIIKHYISIKDISPVYLAKLMRKYNEEKNNQK